MSKEKVIRLGIVGMGHRAKYLMTLYAAHPNCKVVALCDRVQRLVEAAAAELGNPDVKCYTSYEEMLKCAGIDAVLIAVNPDVQVDLACEAMNRGIHVATEVPVAYTIKQCWDLVRTVEKTGLKYQPLEQTRYWGFIQEWRDMARRGEFGHIIFAEGEYLHFEDNWDSWVDPETGEVFGPKTPPVGCQVETTWRHRTFAHPIYYLPHTLSPLLSILDDRVTRVSCMGTRPQGYVYENCAFRDMEIALMHTSKDTVMRVATGYTSPHGPRAQTHCHWYQVMGTKCTAEWARSREEKPKIWRAGDDDWTEMDWSTQVKDSSDFIKNTWHGGADWWPVDTFIHSIVNDTPVPMDVYKAVETAAPAILAAESSEKGGILLEVPNFRNTSREQ